VRSGGSKPYKSWTMGEDATLGQGRSVALPGCCVLCLAAVPKLPYTPLCCNHALADFPAKPPRVHFPPGFYHPNVFEQGDGETLQ